VSAIGANGSQFRFHVGNNGVNPFRVDLLQPIGSVRLALRPGEGAYTVAFKGAGDAGGDVSVEFAVCEAGKSLPAADQERSALIAAEQQFGDRQSDILSPEKRGIPKLPPLPLKDGDEPHFSAAASAAKEYLEGHNLLPFVRALLQTVIRDRPADPFGFIADQFRNASAASVVLNGAGAPQWKPLGAEAAPMKSAPPPLPVREFDMARAEEAVPRALPSAPPAADGRRPSVEGVFHLLPSAGTWLSRRLAPHRAERASWSTGQAAIVVDATGEGSLSGLGLHGQDVDRKRLEDAKDKARAALQQALPGKAVPPDVILSPKQNPMNQSGASFYSHTSEDVEIAKEKARTALQTAMLSGFMVEDPKTEDGERDRELEEVKEKARQSLSALAEEEEDSKASQVPVDLSTLSQEQLEEIKEKVDRALMEATGIDPEGTLDSEELWMAKQRARKALNAVLMPDSNIGETDLEFYDQENGESTLSELEEAKAKAQIALLEALEQPELFELDMAKARAVHALLAAFACDEEEEEEGPGPHEEELQAAKDRAKRALFLSLVDDGPEDRELNADDDRRKHIEDTKYKAKDALVRALLSEAEWLRHEGPDEEVARAKEKARDALEAALLLEAEDEGIELSQEQLQHAKVQVAKSVDMALLARPDLDIDGKGKEMESVRLRAQEALQSVLHNIAELDAVKERAQVALEAALLMEIEYLHADADIELEAAKEKAQKAMENVLLMEAAAMDTDYTEEELQEAKLRAMAALDAALLAEPDLENITPREMDRLKEKAQEALHLALLEDLSVHDTQSAELEAALEIRTKLAVTREEMANVNKALKDEVKLLSQSLASLVEDRDAMRREMQAR